MQVAVAAYACQSMTRTEAGARSGCMGTIDIEQPGLCQAHGDAQHQLGDKTSSFPAPIAALTTVALLPAPLRVLNAPTQSRLDSYYLSQLTHDGSPPLFLRLQVLRI